MDLIKKIKDSKVIWKVLFNFSVEELESIIKYASDRYYNTADSPLTDEEYDYVVDRLRKLKPNSTVLKSIGAPTKGKKVELPYWMGSMDKIKTDSVKEFDKWIKQYNGPYLISDKLDGISCLLNLSDGVIKLYTRGNGEIGQDVTHLLNLVNMSVDGLYDLDYDIAIRGELIMSKKNFKKFSKDSPNARNFVGGIVNSKPASIDADKSKFIDFVAYEIINPIMEPLKQFNFMKKLDLNVAYFDLYDDITLDILTDTFETRKKNSKYDIDGIIVTDNRKHKRNVSGNPPYSFAFKGYTPTAIVKVIEVVWNVSVHGALIPTINYEKTRLSGADLNNATGFHAKFIHDNSIGKGALIKIIRSGDVIPYIMDVVKKAKKPDMPDVDYYWDENGTYIYLENFHDNDTVKIKRLTKFVNVIGVDNLSQGIITNMYNNGIDTIEKILTVEIDDLLQIDGFQKRLATKIYNNINTAIKNINVLKLMKSSNIFGKGIGERKLKVILDAYPNIATDYKKTNRSAWETKLVDLNGFNTITVNKFLDNLPEFQNFYKKISKIIDVAEHVNKVKTNGKFKNQNVVFTGFRENNWKEYIEKEGGKVSSKVSKNTTLLVYKDGDVNSNNYKTAVKLGIKTMDKSAFAKKFDI